MDSSANVSSLGQLGSAAPAVPHQNDLWLLGQDLGDGDTLLLAPGNGVGALPHPVEEADMIETAQGGCLLRRVE